jgi:ABC-type branched-subunit amino acid transport system ATPase component
MEQAAHVADRVLLLEAGQVTRLANAADLLNQESGDAHTLAFAQGIEDA